MLLRHDGLDSMSRGWVGLDEQDQIALDEETSEFNVQHDELVQKRARRRLDESHRLNASSAATAASVQDHTARVLSLDVDGDDQHLVSSDLKSLGVRVSSRAVESLSRTVDFRCDPSRKRRASNVRDGNEAQRRKRLRDALVISHDICFRKKKLKWL
jgi:hypothetical protein